MSDEGNEGINSWIVGVVALVVGGAIALGVLLTSATTQNPNTWTTAYLINVLLSRGGNVIYADTPGDITINGDLKPDGNNTRSIGISSLQWLAGWFNNLHVQGTLNGTTARFTTLNASQLNAQTGNFLTIANTTSIDVYSANASVVGFLDDKTNLANAHNIKIKGSYAYVVDNNVTAGFANFAVIDISSPSSPKVIATIDDDTNLINARELFVTSDYAYIVNFNNGAGANFAVIDISNPFHPAVISSIDDDTNLSLAHGIYVKGNYAYVTCFNTVGGKSNFTVIDISNPLLPVVVGTLDDDTNLYQAHSLDVEGEFAYVSPYGLNVAGKKEFTVVNITNPLAPTVVGSIDNNNLYQLRSIQVSGVYAYAACYADNTSTIGFAVINITDPANPNLVGSLNTSSLLASHDLRVAGKYAYVVTNQAGVPNLVIIDISNPALPVIVNTIGNSVSLNRIVACDLYGKYLYAVSDSAASGKADFSVIDLTSLNFPVINSGIITSDNARINKILTANNAIFSGLNIGLGGARIGGNTSIYSIVGGLNVTGNIRLNTGNLTLTVGNISFSNNKGLFFSNAAGTASANMSVFTDDSLYIVDPVGFINLQKNSANDITMWGGTSGTGRNLSLMPSDASGGATLKDSPALRLRAAYWNGSASTLFPFTITNVITTTTPSNNVTFSINGTPALNMEGIGASVGVFISVNGTMSKVYAGAANSGGTGYKQLIVVN